MKTLNHKISWLLALAIACNPIYTNTMGQKALTGLYNLVNLTLFPAIPLKIAYDYTNRQREIEKLSPIQAYPNLNPQPVSEKTAQFVALELEHVGATNLTILESDALGSNVSGISLNKSMVVPTQLGTLLEIRQTMLTALCNPETSFEEIKQQLPSTVKLPTTAPENLQVWKSQFLNQIENKIQLIQALIQAEGCHLRHNDSNYAGQLIASAAAAELTQRIFFNKEFSRIAPMSITGIPGALTKLALCTAYYLAWSCYKEQRADDAVQPHLLPAYMNFWTQYQTTFLDNHVANDLCGLLQQGDVSQKLGDLHPRVGELIDKGLLYLHESPQAQEWLIKRYADENSWTYWLINKAIDLKRQPPMARVARLKKKYLAYKKNTAEKI